MSQNGDEGVTTDVSGTERTWPALTISVVIPAFNPGSDIWRTLERISACDIPEDVDLEIVVSDDGSTDGATEQVASMYPRITVVRGSHDGPAAARNRGASESSGEVLVFVDCGDEPRSNWVTRITAPFRDPQVGVASWSAVAHDHDSGGSVTVYPDRHGSRGINALAGCFAVRRSLFDAVGGYDTRLWYGENSDLWNRVATAMESAGLRVSRAFDVLHDVEFSAPSASYDRKRLDAVEYLLERDRAELDYDRERRARLSRIAAVNAGRCGDWQRARQHAWVSIWTEPRKPRNYVRAALTLCPPLALRRWSAVDRRRRIPLEGGS